jgi:hypothetical protein
MPAPAPIRLVAFAVALAAGVVASASETKDKAFEPLGFEVLASFHYAVPGFDAPADAAAAQAKGQIPESVRKLDAKTVAITGFMLPTKFQDGKVTEFLLMKDQSACCFGAMPRINEWIIVRMGQGGIPPLMDIPLTLGGKLKVGELYEEGYLSAIYQLDGEKLLKVSE